MVSLDTNDISQFDIYKILIGSILPRPIAFVSTINKAGITNAAPFSAYNLVASNPATLVFSIACDKEGTEKDTLRNIKETNEFVVNSANESFLEKLVQSAARYPSEKSEIEEAGLTALSSIKVKAPRIAESKVQFECELYKLVPIGNGETGSSHLVVGKIVYIHVADECYQDGKILLDIYQPISKLSGYDYGTIGDKIPLKVPKLDQK